MRYCDDLVILVQHKEEAEQIFGELKELLADNRLAVSVEKTRLISFGRGEKSLAEKEGRHVNTFDFLGFTHVIGKSCKGNFKVGRRTSGKRFRQKIVAMNQWLSTVRYVKPIREW